MSSHWQTKRAARLQIIDDYLEANLGTLVNMRRLAMLLDLKYTYFFRAFRLCTGTSPEVYVMRKKLLRAQHLLLNTTYTVYEVAEMCGFCDSTHFRKYFRKQVGTSPGHWRHSHG